MYRDDWDAAVARAHALETELRQANQAHVKDLAAIARLTDQLQAVRAELARLQQGAPPAYLPYTAPLYTYTSRGTTILTLGILSLVICQILGPIAWAMGNEERRRIALGQTPPDGDGVTNAGRICGIIGTALLGLGIVAFVIGVLGVIAMGSHHD